MHVRNQHNAAVRGRIAPLAIALTLLAATANAGDAPMDIRRDGDNPAIVLRNGDELLAVSLRAPWFTFADLAGPVGGRAPDRIDGDPAADGGLTVSYAPIPVTDALSLEVTLIVGWSPEENVLRKIAAYRLVGDGAPLRLHEIAFDAFPADRVEPFHAAPPRSFPAFLPGFFVGIEFPASAVRIQDDRLVIAHRPLTDVAPGAPRESLTAVYGLAGDVTPREAFHAYIDRLRPEPKGLHLNYNSWWTSPVPFTEADILELMSTFEEKLYKAHGVAFDTFTIDMGWSDVNTVWEIDRDQFPEEFARIRAGAEAMGGHLGLWTSPSAFYSGAVDTARARDAGYETFEIPWGAANVRLLSLGGPKYAAAYRDRIADLVGRFDIRQVKLDGLFLGHDDMAGPYSSEQTVLGAVEAFRAIRRANPNVWLECTFDANASPWWLRWLNSVIGAFGDDSPYGRIPCPVYRESYTSARDYFNLRGADRLPSPIAAQEILGLIHQGPECFMNDAVVTLSRGHAFVPMYVNPKFMDDTRWERLADVMRWARANESVLVRGATRPLRQPAWQGDAAPRFAHDEPMPRQPYGYAHFAGHRALITLRNPWIAPQSYRIALDELDVSGNVSVVSLYPEPRLYAADHDPATPLRIPLAPYETVVLSVATEHRLDDLPPAAKRIGKQFAVSGVSYSIERAAFDDEDPPYGPDYTSRLGDVAEAANVLFRGKVEALAPDSTILFLVESETAVPEAEAALRIDGADVPLTTIRSDQGFAASSVPAFEHWLFLSAELPEGEHEIELNALIAGDEGKVSAWTWAVRPGEKGMPYPNRLPEPERVSLDAAALIPRTDLVVAKETAPQVRPKTRIDGVYLDWLEPASVEQGWGELQRNRSVWERPMTIAGVRYLRGIGTHAPARIVYDLAGAYRRFQAAVGADSAVHGSVTFEVRVDGESRFATDVMRRDDPAREVDIDVAGAQTLELIVTDAGDGVAGDHANWADARLLP